MPEPAELARIIDHAYVAALWRLGHPPRCYLDFRHRVAEAVLKRLRART